MIVYIKNRPEQLPEAVLHREKSIYSHFKRSGINVVRHLPSLQKMRKLAATCANS